MKKLERHNARVRRWANQQPAKYRKSALAFGYRCDADSCSFSGTLDWISKKSRQRKGEGVSRKTLVRHLRAFEDQEVIKVERRRNGDKNMSSVYTVDFDKVIPVDDATAWEPDDGNPWDDVRASNADQPLTGNASVGQRSDQHFDPLADDVTWVNDEPDLSRWMRVVESAPPVTSTLTL